MNLLSCLLAPGYSDKSQQAGAENQSAEEEETATGTLLTMDDVATAIAKHPLNIPIM